MYKWGFFILLGVNAYTFGSHFISEDKLIVEAKETVLINDKTLKVIYEPKTFKAETVSHRKRVLSNANDKDHLEETVKEKLLQDSIEENRYEYSYFFEYNNLSPENMKKVELVFIAWQANSDLVSEVTESDFKIKLDEVGLSLNEIQHVVDLMDKEWTYLDLQGLGVREGNIRGNITNLVDEIFYFNKGVMNSNLIGVGSGYISDPFGEPDPFAEADPFEEESDLEIRIEIREDILNIVGRLTKEGLALYDKQVNILSAYLEVSDLMKLKILENMTSF